MQEKSFRIISKLCFCIVFCISSAKAATVSTPTNLYTTIHIDTKGPMANESDQSPNPFLDIRYDVNLISPSGQRITVPGFFTGDGNGSATGSVWRARFTPDEIGEWEYQVRLLQGSNAAVSDDVVALQNITEEKNSGTFNVGAANNADHQGRLKYVGEHYLKYEENFFGYNGFDNTINQPGGVGEAQLAQGLHHYAEHVADWNPGDPLFSSADSGVDSKGIIGAVNYLASEGVNSMYFLLMNLGGDGRDTYPFTGASGSPFDNTHYDISKLAQWNTVLEHMQSKGIAAHLVLGEQEEGNKTWLDNAIWRLHNTYRIWIGHSTLSQCTHLLTTRQRLTTILLAHGCLLVPPFNSAQRTQMPSLKPGEKKPVMQVFHG